MWVWEATVRVWGRVMQAFAPGPTGDPRDSAVMSAAEVEASAAVPSSPVLKEQLTVGTQVVLRTTFGEEISSTVFAHDLQSSCLLLREPGAHNGVATLRLLRSAFIEEVVSTKQPEQTNLLDYADELPELCGDKCKRREERALAAAELDASRVRRKRMAQHACLHDAGSLCAACASAALQCA